MVVIRPIEAFLFDRRADGRLSDGWVAVCGRLADLEGMMHSPLTVLSIYLHVQYSVLVHVQTYLSYLPFRCLPLVVSCPD